MTANSWQEGHEPLRPPQQSATGPYTAPDEKSTDRTSMLFTYGIFFARRGGRRLLGWTKVQAGCMALGFIVLTAPQLAGTINFTPHPSTYELEGGRFPNVAFTDGQNTVFWTPPAGWEMNGGAGRVNLKPANIPQATASLSSIELPEPLPIDEQNTSKFVDMVISSLARESDKPEVLAIVRNPLRICGHETLDVTVRHTLNGQTYCKSVLFLVRGREQLRFELIARQNDFAKLHEAFQKSFYSMRGL